MGGRSGGILLIGLGVMFLSLAYTGRAQKVWTALTGDSGPAATGEDASKAPTADDGDTKVAVGPPAPDAPARGGAAVREWTGEGPAGRSTLYRI